MVVLEMGNVVWERESIGESVPRKFVTDYEKR